MRLRELQRSFQNRILAYESGIEAQFKSTPDRDLGARIEVYVGGYRKRLVEALGTTYPALRATLGEDEFERQMHSYIDRSPSQHYSVRQYGAAVAQHLLIEDPNGDGPALGELAQWEWTLADVFDAADDEPVALAALAGVPPESWPSMTFEVRASLRRLETQSNIVDWWRAANGLRERPAMLAASEPMQWVLWRRGVKTLFRSLGSNEAAAFDDAAAGESFGAICERMAHRADDSTVALQAASLLHGWICEELIAKCSWISAAQ